MCGVTSRNHYLIQYYKDVHLYFSSQGSLVLAFIFWSWSILYMAWGKGPHSFFVCVDTQLCQHHLLNTPLNCLDNFVENQWIISVKVYFWILNFIPLICMSILMPARKTTVFLFLLFTENLDYCSLAVSFESNVKFFNFYCLHSLVKVFPVKERPWLNINLTNVSPTVDESHLIVEIVFSRS